MVKETDLTSRTGSRGHRDPSATVRRIIEAARIEFGANGFDGTRMEHIARRAHVSKQLVYFYFNGKDELYGELLKAITLNSYKRLLELDLASLDPDAAIRLYIGQVFDQFASEPEMAMVTIDQSLHDGAQIRMPAEGRRMHETLLARLDEALARGRAQGLFGHHVNVDNLEFMTTIIVSGCVSSRRMFNLFVGSNSEPEMPEVWRDRAVDFIMRALRA